MEPTERMQPMTPTDRRKPCDREPDLLDALAASMPTLMPMSMSMLPEALRAHVADCAACRETLEVWRYLQAESQAIDRELADVPTRHAGLIWWRRRILDEQAAAHRLLQPIAAFEIAAGLLGLIALAALTISLMRQGFGVATPADAPLMPLVSGLALAAFLPLAWAVRAALALWSRESSAASDGHR